MKNGDYISIPMTRTEWSDVLDQLVLSDSHVLKKLKSLIRRRLREPRNPLDTRYRLGSDDSCHKFVVPVGYENHFEKILLDGGDPAEYYTRVEGGLTFTDPLEL